LLQRGVDLVWCELGEALLEEVYLELEVKIFFLEVVDLLVMVVLDMYVLFEYQNGFACSR
jgi:hypothetical protein